MGVDFGLAEYKGALAGVHLQNMTIQETASTAEAINEDGDIEQIDIYGAKKQLQAEGTVITGGTISALTVGASLTVNNVTYKIENVSVRTSVTGHKTITVSAVAPHAINAGTGGA